MCVCVCVCVCGGGGGGCGLGCYGYNRLVDIFCKEVTNKYQKEENYEDEVTNHLHSSGIPL